MEIGDKVWYYHSRYIPQQSYPHPPKLIRVDVIEDDGDYVHQRSDDLNINEVFATRDITTDRPTEQYKKDLKNYIKVLRDGVRLLKERLFNEN